MNSDKILYCYRMLSSSTAKAVPLPRWGRPNYASPYGRGGTEGDGEGNGIQTPTANFISIAETNANICRGRRPRRPVQNDYRKPHLYRRNEHLVCRDRRPRLSVMSDYRKPHLNNSRKRRNQAFPQTLRLLQGEGGSCSACGTLVD